MHRAVVLLAVALPTLLLAGLVADVDGPSTVEEARAGTAVPAADTDADGLVDGDEMRRGTDPLESDSDGDGVDDGPGDGINDGREADLGTNVADVDTDGDGLDDGVEADLGTDPLDSDTDGDGFADGREVVRTDVLPGADPLRIDVYVEVDAIAGASLPRSEADRVVEEFAGAPVGRASSRGIALHLVYDDSDLEDRGPVSLTGRPDEDGDETVTIGAYGDDHYDYRGYGYHYLLVVPEVQDVTDAEVLGEAGEGQLLVQSVERSDVRGSTLMHELGHSLGLDRDDFDGIDGYAYSAEEYPSVMNYNTGTGYYGYSAGDPCDDWAAIVDDLYVPDTSGFDEDDDE